MTFINKTVSTINSTTLINYLKQKHNRKRFKQTGSCAPFVPSSFTLMASGMSRVPKSLVSERVFVCVFVCNPKCGADECAPSTAPQLHRVGDF